MTEWMTLARLLHPRAMVNDETFSVMVNMNAALLRFGALAVISDA